MSAQKLSLETNYKRVSAANPVWHVWLGKYTKDQDNVVTRDQGFKVRCDESCLFFLSTDATPGTARWPYAIGGQGLVPDLVFCIQHTNPLLFKVSLNFQSLYQKTQRIPTWVSTHPTYKEAHIDAARRLLPQNYILNHSMLNLKMWAFILDW